MTADKASSPAPPHWRDLGEPADAGGSVAAEAGPEASSSPDPSASSASSGSGSYRVLARKYRPRTFDALIGQEAMVRTLKNAFETGRIAQSYMLTGVRGVGKTTTARILARALNFERSDGTGKATVELDEEGIHCAAIMQSRHVDVLEMDAASHTSIDDIREIIEASRYRPASARYKVYIIDEVHMLSKAAFNGLLKTLEEPPAHVKFIFATTEIRKVPVTVLSRCQRFDLRRVDMKPLVNHLRTIAEAENVTAEAEALMQIARISEGSVRDAMSLLDQGIAHGRGEIKEADVRAMLGLADRTQVIDLFEALVRGKIDPALKMLRILYDSGADPAVVLKDLAAFTHTVTRLKIVAGAGDDEALSQEETSRGKAFAEALSVRILSRLWQMLTKGTEEVEISAKPLAAADMVLVRIAHAADLPTPDEALHMLQRDLENNQGKTAAAAASASPSPSTSPSTSPERTEASSASLSLSSAHRQAESRMGAAGPAPATAARVRPTTDLEPVPVTYEVAPAESDTVRLTRFEDIVAVAQERRDVQLKIALETQVRPVRLSPGRLEIALDDQADADLVPRLTQALKDWTGERWVISVSGETAIPTLRERRQEEINQARAQARQLPLVQAALAVFPDAEIVEVVHLSAGVDNEPDTGTTI